MDELITVIIPVYNAHKYLDRCITSLICQTYTNLQIILVDDGSTDGSSEICDAFSRQDKRVEVIHQTNGGISAARNAGFDCARGEWISFVDSDDYVSLYYIEDMLFAAMRDGCDIAICRHVNVREDCNEIMDFRRTTRTQCITGREACIYHFGKAAELFVTSCGKLFRGSLWTGLRFPEGKINEDLFVSHELFYRIEHVAIIDAVLYAYVQTSGSTMRSAFTPRRLEVLDAWQEGVHFYNSVGESDLANIARRVYCSRVFDALCICKRKFPHQSDILHPLRMRGVEAYIETKPLRGYIDCSQIKVFAYRLKLFVGRWCLPLYAAIFIRGRTYI